jgi:SDR family mycofactocin-dependent oxidoreductase
VHHDGSRRVAIVTGAARGIGAATVLALSRDGWAVVALDRGANDPRLPYQLGSESELAGVVQRARELAGDEARVIAVVGDAAHLEVMRDCVSLAEAQFGGLDAMIAVAGVIAGGVPLWELPVEQEEALLDGNLRSALVAARAGVPALLRRSEPRAGRFLAVASAAATRGLPLLAAYCASKAGVAGLVRGLAAELRGTGVTANAVAPGSTNTEMLAQSARLYELESAEAFSRQQPVERLLTPEEVAGALVWLAGPDGAGVTGATIPVDGGLAL